MTSPTLPLTCAGCNATGDIPAHIVLITQQAGALQLMWPCDQCAAGWRRVTHPAAKQLVLASGALVRRPGVSGWPVTTLLALPPNWPAARPQRPSPLSRLAQLLGRRSKPDEDEGDR